MAPADFGRDIDAYQNWLCDVNWGTQMAGGSGGYGASLDGATGWDRDASSHGMAGYMADPNGMFEDRLTGDYYYWDFVYHNYVVPNSSKDPQDILGVLNSFNSTSGLGTPTDGNNQIIQSTDHCGVNSISHGGI